MDFDDALRKFDSLHPRHDDVRDEDFQAFSAPRMVQRLLSAFAWNNRVPVAPEDLRGDAPYDVVVFTQEDYRFVGCRFG